MSKEIIELTCIMCPVGCSLTVTKDGNQTTVAGNSCPRGYEYGLKEVTSPERIVTSVLKYRGGTITIKTDRPIPKDMVDKCLKFLSKITLTNKIKTGDVIVKNVLGTSSNIVLTSVNLD